MAQYNSILCEQNNLQASRMSNNAKNLNILLPQKKIKNKKIKKKFTKMNHKIAGQQTDGHIKNFPDFRYIRLINQ